LIQTGQTIEVPSKKELLGIAEPPSNSLLVPPNGLAEIRTTFGDIINYLREDGTLDPAWERNELARAPLPFPIPLSWDRTKLVTTLYCHKKLTEVFPAVFSAIDKEGLRKEVKTYGGCFNFRSKRTSGKFSTHSWGIPLI